jgi:hypothetical protein
MYGKNMPMKATGKPDETHTARRMKGTVYLSRAQEGREATTPPPGRLEGNAAPLLHSLLSVTVSRVCARTPDPLRRSGVQACKKHQRCQRDDIVSGYERNRHLPVHS